jgi:CheY-like chemotaxis protein
MMGGPLAVGKATGKGSRIGFTLNLTGLGRVEPEVPPRDLAGTRAVVIAEREALREAVAEMLRGFATEPVTAGDVAAAAGALGLAGDAAAAVVLVDARLGGKTPEDILRALREAPPLAGVPVVFLVPPGARAVAALCEGTQAVTLATPVLPAPLLDAVRTARANAEPREEGDEAAAAEAAGEAAAEPAGDRPTGAVPHRLDVLVADDNAVNRLVLATMLEKQGHRVVSAEDGKAALAAIDEGDFDLVLLDVEMPELDGYQVTAEIRDRERRRGTHVPIVAVTAGALEGERDRCLAAGMDGFLAKPIRSAQLAEAMATLRPGAAAPPPDPLPDGLFDPDRLSEVARGGLTSVLDMVRQFDQDARRLLGVLHDGVAASEPERVTRAAIRLRAMLGAMAAWSAYGPAWRLETIGRSGDLAAAAEALSVVEAQVGELQEALQTIATGDAPVDAAVAAPVEAVAAE